ncbi:uncharacterized protein LOC129801565 [Phlebotomus papatasi]|uniref:uncharacterized protein LOC129801565 n=1 Tax=Phlebotomus papatasi TaxID=29031 RepID=UPI00248392E1|nr:uncharacterized protein LOC129801565 [Phlebotomus papatasi]XP_055702754.1 uncharacterized protein LOC129801565 [Phlebotomus papatasi]
MPSAASQVQQNGQEVERHGRRFLLMERADGNPSGMASVLPYNIKDTLNNFGQLKISLLRNHTVLIETQDSNQAKSVLGVTKVGNVAVKVSEHPKLNRSQGVIKCWNFCNCDPAELLEHLKEYNVVGLRQIKRHMTPAEEAKCIEQKKKPRRKNTGIFLVTFDTPDLPSKLNVGLGEVEVQRYIPKPLRCFRCQRLGHAVITCKEKAEQNLPQKKNKKPPKCINCSGNHMSWDKTCPVYLSEAAILKIKAEKNVPYCIAKTLFEESSKTPGKTATQDQVAPIDCKCNGDPEIPAVAPKTKKKKNKKSA